MEFFDDIDPKSQIDLALKALMAAGFIGIIWATFTARGEAVSKIQKRQISYEERLRKVEQGETVRFRDIRARLNRIENNQAQLRKLIIKYIGKEE